jgi:hypothetical protein
MSAALYMLVLAMHVRKVIDSTLKLLHTRVRAVWLAGLANAYVARFCEANAYLLGGRDHCSMIPR